MEEVEGGVMFLGFFSEATDLEIATFLVVVIILIAVLFPIVWRRP